MYFPPLVWKEIRDYMGIWINAYNKVVEQVPKIELNSEYTILSSIRYPDEAGWWRPHELENWLKQPGNQYLRIRKDTQKFYIGPYIKDCIGQIFTNIIVETYKIGDWAYIKEDGTLYYYKDHT